MGTARRHLRRREVLGCGRFKALVADGPISKSPLVAFIPHHLNVVS